MFCCYCIQKTLAIKSKKRLQRLDTKKRNLFWCGTRNQKFSCYYFRGAATGHVHWRTPVAVAEIFLEVGCSLISSLPLNKPSYCTRYAPGRLCTSNKRGRSATEFQQGHFSFLTSSISNKYMAATIRPLSFQMPSRQLSNILSITKLYPCTIKQYPIRFVLVNPALNNMLCSVYNHTSDLRSVLTN